MKTAVVYWSGTGNTEMMAQEVLQGMKDQGAEAEMIEVSSFQAEQMGDYDEFVPVFEACESALSGKKIGLFGSYGWGDGEWMRNWEAKCREDGANLVQDGVICNEEPDDEAKEACQELGRALAQ